MIARKNNLYLEKMKLTDDFVNLHAELQKQLDLASLCISKAKTTHGITLFSVNSVDSHDLEPSVRVEIGENGTFSILKEEEETEKDDGAEELEAQKLSKNDKEDEDEKPPKNSGESEDVDEKKKSRFAGQFRPFGVLESTAAKDARKIMKNAIQTLVEMASTQQSIIEKAQELREN